VQPAPDIEIALPQRSVRRWQTLIVERLQQSGRSVAVRSVSGAPPPWPRLFDVGMTLDRRLFARSSRGLTEIVAAPPAVAARPAALRIDLTGTVPWDEVPTLTLNFGGSASPRGIIDSIINHSIPDVDLLVDGVLMARARPMIDNRASIAAGVDDVLARAATLTVSMAHRLLDGSELPSSTEHPSSPAAPRAGLLDYVHSQLKRVGREVLRRYNFRFAHWQSGYRLAGDPAWHQLGEDGSRFFADPFPFVRDGKRYVFVEDFDHATKKGVISVFEIDDAGNAGRRHVVLEEPTHLSYPQVFEHAGDIWMIPENSAGREVVLYRAQGFPHRWSRHAVLISGAEISDATLLQRDGLFWLFGTLRDGYGSTSDTLVVYHAPTLAGPWVAHAANPILIDRTAARPAGAFIEREGRTWLPVQDGTDEYGGGIGISELLELSVERIRMGPAKLLWPLGEEPQARIHTYNRHAGLEVIDWKIAQPRRRLRATSSAPAVKHAARPALSAVAQKARTELPAE
jgi:hypothetical protein